MSRLNDLLRELRTREPALARDLEREVSALADRRAFGLNFERHVPEAVELPGRRVRKGDKVRILTPRGLLPKKSDETLWRVVAIYQASGAAAVAPLREATGPADTSYSKESAKVRNVPLEDLVVVAEFRDPIYPGLVSTGKVERGGDGPYHTVINAENFHALQTLLFTHRGKVDAIYIDPPYNTGARDWKYNNDYVETDDLYRHSKWLAMMERRLSLAKELLRPDESVLIAAIDEKEYLRLGLLLEQLFPESRIQMISTQINPAVVARAGRFGRADEYLFFVMLGEASPLRVPLPREWVSARGRTHTGTVRWDLLRRSGEGASRYDSPGCFYPIYIDPKGPRVHSVGEALARGESKAPAVPGAVALLPIRKDGSEGRWQWTPETLRQRLEQGRVKISGSPAKGFVVSILKDGEFAKIEAGEFKLTGTGETGALQVETREIETVLAVPGTQWRISSHDATQYGTRLLSSLISERKFPFPKSLYAVEDALRFFVANKPNAIILDFFSGSGTTAHAVMRLNKQDQGRRQSISITNNEVATEEHKTLREKGLRPGDPEWELHGICEYITKARIKAAITGKTPSGEPIKGEYKFTDEFSISEGIKANAEFFTLTYEAPLRVASNREFAKVAPLLWLRAGSKGRRIDDISTGWAVADTYGILADLDKLASFLAAVGANDAIAIAYVVTDEDRIFETVAQQLPTHVEPVRLYESYLRNFEIESGRGAL